MPLAAASAEAQYRHESVVHTPELLARDVACELAQTCHVDRTDLFDEHACGLTFDLYLRSEGCGSRALRCGGDENHRTGEEFVGLYDDAEAVAVLFVPDALRKSESVDVTP